MKPRKCAQKDFTAESLPKNREEVFFDCLKIRYYTFLQLGLVAVLFALPSVAAVLVGDILNAEIYTLAQSGVIDKTAVADTVNLVNMCRNLALILFLALYGAGLAGIMNVVKQLVWGEGIIFPEDFRRGLKQSGLRYSLTFAFCGVVNFVNAFVYSLDIPAFIGALPYAAAFVVLLPAGVMMLFLDGVYKFTFLQSVKTAFSLYIRTLPKTLLASLICISPLLLLLIPDAIIKSAAVAVAVIVLSPMLVVGLFLYGSSVADKFINKDRFPHIVDKGVHRKNK